MLLGLHAMQRGRGAACMATCPAATHQSTPVPCPPHPALQRSSGSAKGWGLPLRYPSQDGPLPLSARASPPGSARILAGALAEGGAEAEEEAASGGSSPAATAGGGFAVLADDEGGLSCDEADGEEEAGEQQAQQAALAQAAPAPAGSFSFGTAAGAAMQQPPLGNGSTASSPPPPAAIAASSPVLSPEQLQQGARLFSFAAAAGASPPLAGLPPGARASAVLELAPAGADSEEEQFFSALPSRAPSAALTAYASARSLRWGGRGRAAPVCGMAAVACRPARKPQP